MERKNRFSLFFFSKTSRWFEISSRSRRGISTNLFYIFFKVLHEHFSIFLVWQYSLSFLLLSFLSATSLTCPTFFIFVSSPTLIFIFYHNFFHRTAYYSTVCFLVHHFYHHHHHSTLFSTLHFLVFRFFSLYPTHVIVPSFLLFPLSLSLSSPRFFFVFHSPIPRRFNVELTLFRCTWSRRSFSFAGDIFEFFLSPLHPSCLLFLPSFLFADLFTDTIIGTHVRNIEISRRSSFYLSRWKTTQPVLSKLSFRVRCLAPAEMNV